jgi:hypothetical protein
LHAGQVDARLDPLATFRRKNTLSDIGPVK